MLLEWAFQHGWPWTSTMRSLVRRPARSAGDPGTTPWMARPVLHWMPKGAAAAAGRCPRARKTVGDPCARKGGAPGTANRGTKLRRWPRAPRCKRWHARGRTEQMPETNESIRRQRCGAQGNPTSTGVQPLQMVTRILKTSHKGFATLSVLLQACMFVKHARVLHRARRQLHTERRLVERVPGAERCKERVGVEPSFGATGAKFREGPERPVIDL